MVIFISQISLILPLLSLLKLSFLLKKGLEDNAAWPPFPPWLHHTGVYCWFDLPGGV